MDSHLTPLWEGSLKGAVWLRHWHQKNEPKPKCWHREAFGDLIHNSTDENKPFSQTSEKEMSTALSKRPQLGVEVLDDSVYAVIF